MSHCVACDRLLTDREAARKHRKTGEELGLCDHCLASVEEVEHIPTTEPLDHSCEADKELDELLDQYPCIPGFHMPGLDEDED